MSRFDLVSYEMLLCKSIPMRKYLRFGRRLHLHTLSHSPVVKDKLYTEKEIRKHQQSGKVKYLSCAHVWCAADGPKVLNYWFRILIQRSIGGFVNGV